MLGEEHKRTAHISSSLDFFATVSEILGVPHPKPRWRMDSKSLLPLLDGRQSLDSPRNKPIGWQYWGYGRVNNTPTSWQQRALTNQTDTGTWKLVEKPGIGEDDHIELLKTNQLITSQLAASLLEDRCSAIIIVS